MSKAGAVTAGTDVLFWNVNHPLLASFLSIFVFLQAFKDNIFEIEHSPDEDPASP